MLLHLVDGHERGCRQGLQDRPPASWRPMATDSTKSPRSSPCRKPMRSIRRTLKEQLARLKRRAEDDAYVLSAVSGQGVHEVLQALLGVIDDAPEATSAGTVETARENGIREPALGQFRRDRPEGRLGAPGRPRAGTLNHAWLAALAEDIADLMRAAPTCWSSPPARSPWGARVLGPARALLKLEESQAAAAVGQIALARAWSEVLAHHGITAGQILVTLADTEERRRYLNARATTLKLLEMRAVPVINENDTVATSRDPLRRQRPACRAGRDDDRGRSLVLFSDIDGLYTAPPARPVGAAFIPVVERITPAIEAMAGGRPRSCRAAACGPRSRPARLRRCRRHPHGHRRRAHEEPAQAHRRGRALHLVPDALEPRHRAQDLDCRRAGAPRHPSRGRGRGPGTAGRRKPAAGRASGAIEGTFSRGDAVTIRDGARRARARVGRLRCRGGRPDRRPAEPKDRDHSRLSRPSRDGAPGRLALQVE